MKSSREIKKKTKKIRTIHIWSTGSGAIFQAVEPKKLIFGEANFLVDFLGVFLNFKINVEENRHIYIYIYIYIIINYTA